LIKNIFAGDTHALKTHLAADEKAITTIDSRTGRINLRDTGDLAAAGRGPRFLAISDKLNENPTMLLEALVRLRLNVSFLYSLVTHRLCFRNLCAN
jgi:mediator of RNA polymerase II transcription subunit 14